MPDEPNPEPTSPRRAVEQAGMNRLQVALDNRRRELGLTFADLAGKAGLRPSTARWLVRGTVRQVPTREQLEGLARALDLRLLDLQRLVGEAYGVWVYTPRSGRGRNQDMETLIAAAAELAPHELRAVLALVDELRRPD